MHGISVTLDHDTLVWLDARDDEVDGTAHWLRLQSLDCSRIVGLLGQHLPQQPEGRNGVILENTDQIIHEVLGIPRIAIYCK